MKQRMTCWVLHLLMISVLMTSSIFVNVKASPTVAPRVQVSAAGDWVNYGAPQALDAGPVAQAAAARPLSLAAADLNLDGQPEIVAGYAIDGGGLAVVYYTVNGGAAQSLALPIAPDFLHAGDFNADGQPDLVAAARGSDVLWFLPGNGAGGLGAAEALALPGNVTALAAGELYRKDGLIDLAVGIAGAQGAQLLVFVGEQGAQAAAPERFDLPAPAVALAFGQLDDDYPYDLAAVAGRSLIVLRGVDHLAVDRAAPTLESVDLDFEAVSLTIGDWNYDQSRGIALLGADGQVRVANSVSISDLTFDVLPGSQPVSGSAQLLRAKTSSLPADDLLVAGGRQVRVLTADGRRMNAQGIYEQAAAPGALAALDAAAPVVAMLAVRLNDDALDDLVILTEGAPAPLTIITAAVRTFVVKEPWGAYPDANPGDGVCASPVYHFGGPYCTLRAAIMEANASPGLDRILFDTARISRVITMLGGEFGDAILPTITEAVEIIGDGDWERQKIDGRLVEPAKPVLLVNASGVTIIHLNMYNFVRTSEDNPVIKVLGGANNEIRSCIIGPRNTGAGIELVGGDTRLSWNVISGNHRTGVHINGGDGHTISSNNFIGLPPESNNYASTTGNHTGVKISSGTYAQVGGGSYTRNVISGNRDTGIVIAGGSGALILNNYIGLHEEGLTGLGNQFGVKLIGGAATTIGNGTAAGRNLIGGNDHSGIQAADSTISELVVNGNYIGVNVSGDASLPNRQRGVVLSSTNPAQVRNNVLGCGTSAAICMEITGSNWTVAHEINSNHIGADPTGAINLGGGVKGVSIKGVHGVQFDGNHIRHSGQDGLSLVTSSDNTISNNHILYSGQHGVLIDADNNTLSGNVVSFSGVVGIKVLSNDNTLTNNTISSVRATGSESETGLEVLGRNNEIAGGGAPIVGGLFAVKLIGNNNNLSGHEISDADVGVFVSGEDNVVGPDNLIHSNWVGVDVASSARRAVIKGSNIGIDASGLAALPNYQAGIVDSGRWTTIGGAAPADGNLIGGGMVYGSVGIHMLGTQSTVRYNTIGVGINGATPLGALAGIQIDGDRITIWENVIAYNTTGVLVNSGRRNSIWENSIHSNYIGLDLSPAGVTLNDSGDGDAGANDLQNYPLITFAALHSGQTLVSGMLDSQPNQTYAIHLYSSPACDPSGYGQGRTYLGQATVTTNAGGQASIDIAIGAAASVGHYLTATATDPEGNTSEFSACYGPISTLERTFTVNTAGDAADNNPADGICDSSADPGEQCTLRAAIQQANASPGDYTIILPAGVYPLTIAGFDDTAEAGDLDITGPLTIVGAGANVTIIHNQVITDRVFDIRSDAVVTLTGVTLKGGNLSTTANGAGIRVNTGTTLILDGVSVQENQTAAGSGGGIYSAGTLTLTNSAIISNTAGGEANGGGGLYVYLGTATLRNVTVSGNQSNGHGGGIQNLLGTVSLNNVTVHNNTADDDNDNSGDGGGVYNTATFEVKNSIIAENEDKSKGVYEYGVADCYGAFTTQGYNLIGDKAQQNNSNPPACQGFGGSGDNAGGFWALGRYLRYAAGLLPLQLNGGATLSHAPFSQAAGWAVDWANPATPGSGSDACEPFDQRGQPRPVDGGTDGVARCDRGAVELVPAYLYVDDVLATEGSPAVFTVSLSEPAPITFTVHYSTTDISAIAGQDYIHTEGVLTFTPGQSSQTVSVSTLTDTRSEDVETFRLRLFWAQWVIIADGEGIGGILDGSPLPALSINDRTVTEGDQGSNNQAILTVSLNSPSGKTVTVDYTTVDGTALAGEDYGAAQGTLTFAPGETSRTITVNIIGDDLREGNETLTVQLSNPVNATLGDASGQVTITDDDTPALSIDDSSVLEGDSGTSPMTFIVELSKPSTAPITVNYITSPGTAKSGSDYVHTAGTLTFAAGETLKTITVQIVGDEQDEPAETFTVSLNTPTGGAVIARSSATGAIWERLYTVYLPLVLRNVGP